MKIKIANELIT